MFSFLKKLFRKKKVNETQVKEFDWAMQAIEIYIALLKWDKAKKALDEILYKEKKSFTTFIENLWKNRDIKIINKEKEKFEEKKKKILELQKKEAAKEQNFLEKKEEKRFKIKFKSIKNEINRLLKTGKNVEAMWLLQSFLEENNDNIFVINFYNKQKKKIQKQIDRERKNLKNKFKDNAKAEAMTLIWKEIKKEENKKETIKNNWFFAKIIEKINFWSKMRKKVEEQKLLNEVNLLIEEDSKLKKEIAKQKLENMHKWLVKELQNDNLVWYDIYWKILWADKISGDAFWVENTKTNYKFFLWDATGHWIKAWFIITLLNKAFKENITKPLKELIFNLNNALKQSLQSRNFVTWWFFEVEKKSSKLSYVWMWHEPILIYREKTWEVEKKVLWWLAAGIRIMNNIDQVKVRELKLNPWDIFIIFSDWIVEARNEKWEMYAIDKLAKTLLASANNTDNIKKIYVDIMNDVRLYRWWTKFDDDASILLVKRNPEKDLVKETNKELDKLKKEIQITKKEEEELKWKTKLEMYKEIELLKKKKETERIVEILKEIYLTGEVLKLKQEAIRYIKEWYIHKKINYYLKKALEKETEYKLNQKNKKVENKYNVLKEIYKKWDYDTVIKEIETIILKDWEV